MKKTIFISTCTLILLSVIAKAASFFVRILLARGMSTEAMSLYSLVSPTMLILITIAQMGIPAAISKVMAQNDRYQKPLFSALLFTIVTTVATVVLFAIFIPFLSTLLFHDAAIDQILYAILPLIPLVALSGLCKGYLLGKRHHLLSTSSQIIEEAARIAFLLFTFQRVHTFDPYQMAALAMFSISIGEFASAVYMMLCMHLSFSSLKAFPHAVPTLKKEHYDQVLQISIPMTSSRFIGSFTSFLEPLLMLALIKESMHAAMIEAYGIINGYLLPLLTMPSFLTITLSNMLLPAFTYRLYRHDAQNAKKLCVMILGTCLLIGSGCAVICFLFPSQLLQLFYHQSLGAKTLKHLAIPFILYALQPPLTSLLHALSCSRQAMWDTILGSLLRLFCVCFLSPFFQADVLSIGLCAGMCLTTLLHAIRLFGRFLHHEQGSFLPKA